MSSPFSLNSTFSLKNLNFKFRMVRSKTRRALAHSQSVRMTGPWLSCKFLPWVKSGKDQLAWCWRDSGTIDFVRITVRFVRELRWWRPHTKDKLCDHSDLGYGSSYLLNGLWLFIFCTYGMAIGVKDIMVVFFHFFVRILGSDG